METKDFAVRTIFIGDIFDKKKKTLVMTHGFASFAMTFYKYLKPLSVKYHIVLFDNCGWGLNTRFDESWCTISSEDADAWFTDWITKLIEALNLPEKFFIAAHAQGNYLMSLYACQRPERVEAFFMISPTHMEAYDKNDYDPYNVRYPKDVTEQFVPKIYVDKALEWENKPCESREHPLKILMPDYKIRRVLQRDVETLFSGIPEYTEEDVKTYTDYLYISYQRLSVIDNAQMLTEKFPMLAVHDMSGPDRLGNPEIDFPIGMCFGDSDIMGTEGADEIVKNNKYFKSG